MIRNKNLSLERRKLTKAKTIILKKYMRKNHENIKKKIPKGIYICFFFEIKQNPNKTRKKRRIKRKNPKKEK